METGIIFINMIVPIIVVFFMGLLMPFLSRREIFFGVRIPYEKAGDPRLKRIRDEYLKEYGLIVGVFTALFIFLGLKFKNNELIYVLGIFIQIGLSSLMYYIFHKKTRELKAKEGLIEGKRESVIVDTSFRGANNKNVLVSPLWFLIPISIIAVNVILILARYDSIPDRIPVHFNIMGQPDRWENKSLGSVMDSSVMQLFITGLMYFTYRTMGWAKQQINPARAKESRYQNRAYRRAWSGYSVYINVCILIIFTVINFNTIGIISLTGPAFSLLIGGITVFILVSTIALSIYTGQGGSRIKLQEGNEENETLMDRDDDRHWKLGMFYYNPNDPAVWVEKRFGIGLTVNFGRPMGIIILVGLIGFIAVFPLIMNLFK